jgi:hypothetical protein
MAYRWLIVGESGYSETAVVSYRTTIVSECSQSINPTLIDRSRSIHLDQIELSSMILHQFFITVIILDRWFSIGRSRSTNKWVPRRYRVLSIDVYLYEYYYVADHL